MKIVRLEFEQLEVIMKKKRWELYFVVFAEHPEDNNKMLVTTVPSDDYISLRHKADNKVFFEPPGSKDGVDGLTVLEREMPADKHVKVRVHLWHSRDKTRSIGELLTHLEDNLGGEALGVAGDIFGKATAVAAPWLTITRKAVPLIGKILKGLKDRKFGMITMDQKFDEDFDNKKELDKENTFSTGNAKITWSWSIN